MDRGEFAASISEEQEKFIADRRDGHIQLANTCIDEYKKHPSEELLRRIESSLECSKELHILLNRFAPLEYIEANQEYQEIKDNHQRNMELVHRNKKLQKTLTIKLLAKAGELLEITYMAVTLGFGAGVGLFVVNQLCKILGV